ncbi:MAG: penicillin-binding transpeptidase domain-containing protein [Eggerthellaceae bacterium]|nr:penicillin-binding transpeptidase domain-containing protein [Eggerthellaceae bacterium]
MVAPVDGIIGTGKGNAASVVCLDAKDGSIIAMANYPTYNPENFVFGSGVSNEIWQLLNTESSHYPLFNRAIAGTYRAASTFKAFTGLAALEYGFADEEREWECEGTWIGFGKEYAQDCWNTYGHGPLKFRQGVVVSCDTVFYEIAKGFYDNRAQLGNTCLQDFVRRFGFGSPTRVDLVGEAVGRVPTPEWKAEYFRDVPEEAPWRPGDLSNMVIGQGYIDATPLQLAVGYAAVATGKRLRPHVLKEVKNSEGETVVKVKAEEIGRLDVNPDHLKIMRDALQGVAAEDKNVSYAFDDYGRYNAAAKTGTAEVEGKGDYGLFACYAPFDDPKYVVAAVVEQGGPGSMSACPVCVHVLDAAMRYDEGRLNEELVPLAGSTGLSLSAEEIKAQTSTGRND